MLALQAMEALVERGVHDLEHAGGTLANPARDAVAVHRLPAERAQDEQVERAVEQVARIASHGRGGDGSCAAGEPPGTATTWLGNPVGEDTPAASRVKRENRASIGASRTWRRLCPTDAGPAPHHLEDGPRERRGQRRGGHDDDDRADRAARPDEGASGSE